LNEICFKEEFEKEKTV